MNEGKAVARVISAHEANSTPLCDPSENEDCDSITIAHYKVCVQLLHEQESEPFNVACGNDEWDSSPHVSMWGA